jgi:uncharacterized membrane protein
MSSAVVSNCSSSYPLCQNTAYVIYGNMSYDIPLLLGLTVLHQMIFYSVKLSNKSSDEESSLCTCSCLILACVGVILSDLQFVCVLSYNHMSKSYV